MKNILILTSGGDAPGMNAAIRAVVRTSYHKGIKPYACHNGYQGLVDENIFQLYTKQVSNCIQKGGTLLRSSRCESFHKKEIRQKIYEFLKSKNIEGLIVIGGNGSFKGASLIETESNLKVVGIPATIDNDIIGTEYSLGFDTARNTALEAIDKIRDTAYSNNRYFLIEVMGHHAGFLALDIGLAAGAEFIITPEFPITTENLAKQIKKPKRKKDSLIVIIAEGGEPGQTIKIAKQLKTLTPFEYRVCVLGHIQRGGSPSAMDRNIGSEMGYMATESLLEEKSCMIAMQENKLKQIPFPTSGKKSYRCLENENLIKLNKILAE